MPRDALTHAEEEGALRDLRRTRLAAKESLPPPSSGVYAIYIRPKGLLAPFVEGANGLIYIGRSVNLADREFEEHFCTTSTGRSTLRRSLGALLRNQLSLKAMPRAAGPSETNVRNYRFGPDGEARLTDWMCEHLEIGFHPSSKYRSLEDCLVPQLRPLLNLTKWSNPHRAEIRRLRRVCAEEARSILVARGTSKGPKGAKRSRDPPTLSP